VEAIVLMAIVRTAEIAVDAVEDPEAGDVIADAAGVVEGLAAVDVIAVDAAGRVGEDTRLLWVRMRSESNH